MKYLNLLLVALVFILPACNNNDEPIPFKNIPVIESFLPVTVIFKESDTEFRDRIKGWNNEKIVVNSSSELPDDPLGFTGYYSKINYKDYTLLLYYAVHTYDMISYRSNVINNTSEKSYDWKIILGAYGDLNNGEKVERLAFTRYAVLVGKIPATESNLKITLSVTDHNWSWE